MVPHTDPPAGDAVTIRLFDDGPRLETTVEVTPALAEMLAYADAWTREEPRRDSATLTFSSTLAALVAGDHPLSEWFRRHLALRGSAAEAMTKGRAFSRLPPPTDRLTTTISFRRALAEAKGLAQGRTLDVKHLLAAYPIVSPYHPEDFLRLRIDRRAWCLALAEHLQRTEPEGERAAWTAYAQRAPKVLMPRYRPDLPAGADLLGVGREVEAFAMLIAARATAMPLSIGLFGTWGSGKSYFMTRLEERVTALSETRDGPYLSRIAQVRFNAWHYSEGDVVASLIDQIFRNLRFGPNESRVVLERRRAEAQAQVAAADREWHELRARAREAAEEEARLREQWREVDSARQEGARQISAALKQAEAALAAAEQRLTETLEAESQAMADARQRATAGAAIDVVTRTILEDPEISPLRETMRRAAAEARWLTANRRNVAWGIGVLALTGVAAFILDRLRDSALITTLGAVVAVVTPLALRAVALLRKLADSGARFESAVQAKSEAAVARIRKLGEEALREREAARQALAVLREQSASLTDAARGAEEALGAGERRRVEIEEKLRASEAAAAAVRGELDSLTLGSLLGETIEEAGGTDVFRKRLGTAAHARGYLQRLSETMARARQEQADGRGEPPVLERVVLYIDDLDRCPEEKVRDVLRAVHLLLAFDLFACVVAVDPRWVLECLARSPGVVSSGARGDADLEVLGGMATASDYLEKIFQIPIWLRPVPAERRAAIAATLLEPATDELPAPGAAPLPPAPADPSGEAAGATRVEPPRPPPQVEIDPRELEFLRARVAPLLDGNTRALKRFANTYYLVKAALSEVEFNYFGNDEPYRVCMAQLALLATQRKRARLLAKLVDDAMAGPAPGTLGEWLDALIARPDEGRSIGADLKAALLTDSPELAKLPFDRFAFWFGRTRRYSFYL